MDASLLESLLPPEVGLHIEHVAIETSAVIVEAATRSKTSTCPRCHRRSAALHSRYRRHLRDRSCRGRQLRLSLSAGKYFCPHSDCLQRIFCERLPGLAKERARTSTDLDQAHRSLGLALGGEAGARLAAALSIPTSPDTILRRVKEEEATESLNRQFTHWVEQDYNATPHDAIGLKPIDRFGIDLARVRFLAPSEHHDELFYAETKRTVKKDNTFSFQSRRYETPADLRGQDIQLRHDRQTASPTVIIYHRGLRIGPARLLDPVANGLLRRKEHP